MTAALHVPAWQTAVLLAFAAVVAIFGALYATAHRPKPVTPHERARAAMRRQRWWLVAQFVAGIGGVGALWAGAVVNPWLLVFGPVGYAASAYAHKRVGRAGAEALAAIAGDDDEPDDLVPRHMLDDALADNARLRVKAEMMQLGWLAALADVEALRAQRSYRELVYGPRRSGVAS